MLTQKDFQKISELVSAVVKQVTDELKQGLDEKISHFPTKEEFFARMDSLSGEVKAVREIQDLHAGQHANINDELGKIKKQLHIS